jgi:hypothetical protein
VTGSTEMIVGEIEKGHGAVHLLLQSLHLLLEVFIKGIVLMSLDELY